MAAIWKIKRLLCFLVFGLNCAVQADTVFLNLNGSEGSKLSPSLTDFVRENLIHIFDSSQFHQMKDSALPLKSQKQLEEQLNEVRSGSYIELKLDEPASIVVEGAKLKAVCMWVTIRESDGFVFNWILQQPNGDLVALEKARGELVVQFAPHILRLIGPSSEQAIVPNL